MIEKRLASPIVSVVTRTRNRAELLARAAQSVARQTLRNVRWIVVNDGGLSAPVDAVVARVSAALDHEPIVLHREQSGGMEAASNAGVLMADTRFVAIHDDDDTWEPAFLERMVEAIVRRPSDSIRGAFSHVTLVEELISPAGPRELRRRSFNGHLTSIELRRYFTNNHTPPISFVYERQVHDEIGLYREEMSALGDWEFYLRFFSRFDAVLVTEHLANYHVRCGHNAGVLANSVSAARDRHVLMQQLLWNRLLREDLQAGRFGLGVAIANAQAAREAVHDEGARLRTWLAIARTAMHVAHRGHREVVIAGDPSTIRFLSADLARAGVAVVGFVPNSGAEADGVVEDASFNRLTRVELAAAIERALPVVCASPDAHEALAALRASDTSLERLVLIPPSTFP